MYGTYEWYDAADAACFYGLATNITFNELGGVTLPSTVVYGISYSSQTYGPSPSGNANDPANSLNVVFSTASANVSAGSDTIPGDIFINTPDATNGNIFCNSVTPDTFMAAYNDCSSVSGNPPMYDIPAVEFVMGDPLMSLSPGGPAQDIDLSIYNPGSSAVQVSSVTITINNAVACDASPNFVLLNGTSGGTSVTSTYTLASPQTVPAGGTIDVLSSSTGAAIYMVNTNANQDTCEGVTMPLSFTSS
jgi:hypothetical protein